MGGFGAIGIGAGGLDVALATGGESYTVEMLEIAESFAWIRFSNVINFGALP